MSAPRATYARRPTLLLTLTLALLLPGCSKPPAVDAGWPEGALIVAEREALVALAARAEILAGTPLADAARKLRESLPACAQLEAHDPNGQVGTLLQKLRCSTAEGPLAAVHRARGNESLLFALPVDGSGRAIGRATLTGGNVSLDIEWTPSDDTSVLDLLLPGAAPAGPPRLADSMRLAHLRIRPERAIDLRALVDSDSQANQLFSLRASLFTAAILDGAWETAVYLPRAGSEMPRVAVAFDVRVRSAAIAAAEAFVAELASTWKIEPQPFVIDADTTGACLADLRLMPELAPCYVATEHSLVIGWNAESLTHALGKTAGQATADPGRVEVDLALFTEADALLSRHLNPNDRPGPIRWPWQRAVAQARRDEEGPLRVHLELEGALDT